MAAQLVASGASVSTPMKRCRPRQKGKMSKGTDRSKVEMKMCRPSFGIATLPSAK
jgi:hypothetical protein